MNAPRQNGFSGWKIVAIAFITLGLSVGVPYYNLPFFYDYFQKSFHWSIKQITLGFPLAAILTLWIPPLLIPRFSQRKLIVFGTGLMAIAFCGFAYMGGSLFLYLALYFLWTAGYMFAGPIPHQILVSHWFRKKRGLAMGVMYVGVGLFGGAGSFLVKGVTDHFNYRVALLTIGALVLVTWPLALLVLKDRPGEVGQFPDGDPVPAADQDQSAWTYRDVLRNRTFWLLTIGSICSIGAIGSINQHMKLVFRDAGFHDQMALNTAWTRASVLILWSSIIGRIGIGHLADIFPKKYVMTATYFMVAGTVLLLLAVSPKHELYLYVFALAFGLSMGADYMLIPLMAADRFGVNSLARLMALILPANTLGQTWCPYLVSALRDHSGNYNLAMGAVFGIAMLGAVSIALLPRDQRLGFSGR